MQMKFLLSGAVSVVASSLIAQTPEVWAADGASAVVSVEEGQTRTQGTAVMLADGACMEKIGKGELVLPRESILQNDKFKLKVRDGLVKLSSGGDVPTVMTPTAVLNCAAVWLDATKKITEEDGFVTEWRDCREMKSETPFDFWHASVTYGGTTRPAKVVDGCGRAAVDFGGYGSNAYLGLLAPNASDWSKNNYIEAQDVFIVHSVTRAEKGYGYLFGGTSDPYHPGAAGANLDKKLLRSRDVAQQDTRWWLNGVEIDATRTQAALGAFVFDIKHYRSLPQIHSLFRYTAVDGSLSVRNGGDLVHEVVLFTNKLTSVEHAQVRRYLQEKWGLVSAPTTDYDVTVASGASISGDLENVAVRGGGRLKLADDSNLTWNYDPTSATSVEIDIPADKHGSVLLREDVALVAAGGQTVATENVRNGVQANVTTAGSKSGQIKKEGNERLRVSSVSSDVSMIQVTDGMLDLSPAVSYAGLVAGSCLGASVSNCSFEAEIESKYYFSNMRTAVPGSALGGWMCSYNPGYMFADSYSVIGQIDATKTGWYASADTTDGNCYLGLRGEIQVTGTIDVPFDGWYEAGFDLKRGQLISSRLDVLVDGVGIGSASYMSYGAWSHHQLPRVWLTAGLHSLVFRSVTCQDGSGDTYGRTGFLLDDVKFNLVDCQDGVWPIPNGDFEQATTNSAYAASCKYDGRGFLTSIGSEGWEFVQIPGSSACLIGIVNIGSLEDNSKAYANFSMVHSGRSQLLIASTGTLARTRFRAPAGTWQLHADVAGWRKANLTGRTTVGSDSVDGSLGAKVAVGGNAKVSLGSVALPGSKALRGHWEKTFNVPAGGADVTLEISTDLVNRDNEIGAIVDNLVLVQVGNVENLLDDGEFTASFGNDPASSWVADVSRKTVSGPCQRVRASRGTINPATSGQYSEAPESYDGGSSGGMAVIGDCGALYRRLTFPEAGRYRLTYFTRGRWNGSSFAYCGNSVRPYIAAAGQTNIIDDVRVATTNWVAHNAVFSVPESGAYDFGFVGGNVPKYESAQDLPGYWDKAAFIDGVRIAKLPEGGESEFELPTNVDIFVSKTAKLRLGFTGTKYISHLKLGGRSAYGVVSSATHPDYIVGEGTLTVTAEKPGLMLIVR